MGPPHTNLRRPTISSAKQTKTPTSSNPLLSFPRKWLHKRWALPVNLRLWLEALRLRFRRRTSSAGIPLTTSWSLVEPLPLYPTTLNVPHLGVMVEKVVTQTDGNDELREALRTTQPLGEERVDQEMEENEIQEVRRYDHFGVNIMDSICEEDETLDEAEEVQNQSQHTEPLSSRSLYSYAGGSDSLLNLALYPSNPGSALYTKFAPRIRTKRRLVSIPPTLSTIVELEEGDGWLSLSDLLRLAEFIPIHPVPLITDGSLYPVIGTLSRKGRQRASARRISTCHRDPEATLPF